MRYLLLTLFTAAWLAPAIDAQGIDAQDWLVDPSPYRAKAQLQADGNEIVLSNGLIERRIVLAPNAATVGFRNLITGESILRGVKPEATIELDGQSYAIGGLKGQPNYAFLDPAWIESLKNDPGAFQFQGYELRESIEERMQWKQTRHRSPNAFWPPKGIELILNFAMPGMQWTKSSSSQEGREVVFADAFQSIDTEWKKLISTKSGDSAPKVGAEFQAKAGLQLTGMAGQAIMFERAISDQVGCVEVTIDPMSDRDTSWGPGLTLVGPDGNIEVNLRPGDRGEHGHFELRKQGREQLTKISQFASSDSGLNRSMRYRLRVRWQDGSMVWDAAEVSKTDPMVIGRFERLFEFPWNGRQPTALRIGKSDRQGNATDSE